MGWYHASVLRKTSYSGAKWKAQHCSNHESTYCTKNCYLRQCVFFPGMYSQYAFCCAFECQHAHINVQQLIVSDKQPVQEAGVLSQLFIDDVQWDRIGSLSPLSFGSKYTICRWHQSLFKNHVFIWYWVLLQGSSWLGKMNRLFRATNAK